MPMVLPTGSTLGKKRSLRSEPMKTTVQMPLVFDVGEEAAQVDLRVAHHRRIRGHALQSRRRPPGRRIGDLPAAVRRDADFAHQRRAALHEVVFVARQLGILALQLRETSWDRKRAKTTRSTRKPSLPMVEALLATYTSMPWIIAITAISVAVERMMPSSVRKLRSLLARSDSKATEAASKNEAWDAAFTLEPPFSKPPRIN